MSQYYNQQGYQPYPARQQGANPYQGQGQGQGFFPGGQQQQFPQFPPAGAPRVTSRNNPPPQGMLPIEQSYIENILRLNKGKLATVYTTFEGNSQWNAKEIYWSY